jgi:hypothetical protein
MESLQAELRLLKELSALLLESMELLSKRAQGTKPSVFSKFYARSAVDLWSLRNELLAIPVPVRSEKDDVVTAISGLLCTVEEKMFFISETSEFFEVLEDICVRTTLSFGAGLSSCMYS